MKERVQTIDFLRGVAMIVIIITHTTAFFPSDKFANFIWDWSHFAVPVFIYCSVYLVLQKYHDKPIAYIPFVKKRFLRLIIPYYVFLPFFFITLFFVSPQKLSLEYIIRSLTLTGGVDINWLVLLFIYITLLLPVLITLRNKNRIIFITLFTISFISTFLFLFFKLPFSFRYTMWLPWITVLYFSIYLYQIFQSKKSKMKLIILLVTIFSCGYLFRYFNGLSVVLIHNKYPPNIYYLAYGMVMVLILTSVSSIFNRYRFVTAVINFFSYYSYQLYFVHYIFLTIVAVFIHKYSLNWMSFTVIVFVLSIFVQLLLNKGLALFPVKK